MDQAEYLKALLGELERLHPTRGVTSHGIVLDADDGLLLFYVCGDVVVLVPLDSGDLGDDPVAAAVELHRRASAEAENPDCDLIMYKR